jgi:hypothetical protein
VVEISPGAIRRRGANPPVVGSTLGTGLTETQLLVNYFLKELNQELSGVYQDLVNG